MQVGTTKDQGLYNKPSAAAHPGALAAGTLPHNIHDLEVADTFHVCLMEDFQARGPLMFHI